MRCSAVRWPAAASPASGWAVARMPSHEGSAWASDPKNSAQFSVVSTARARWSAARMRAGVGSGASVIGPPDSASTTLATAEKSSRP